MTCQLCGKDFHYSLINSHHLHPRINGERNPNLPEEERNKQIWTCLKCHDKAHDYFTNEELEKYYYTPELLKNAIKEKERIESFKYIKN
jgi:5-methylcytosine-specific restriction endonuclease McrA